MKKQLVSTIFAFFLIFSQQHTTKAAANVQCTGHCAPITFNCQFGGAVGDCTTPLTHCCANGGTYGCVWDGTSCKINQASATCPLGYNIDPAYCAAIPQKGCGVIKFSCLNTSGGGNLSSGPPLVDCNGGRGFETAIGCIPAIGDTANQGIARFFLIWGIGIGGGIALIMIVIASYMISVSVGDPKKLQAGKELLTSAISGLILVIFCAFILRAIGFDILGIF